MRSPPRDRRRRVWTTKKDTGVFEEHPVRAGLQAAGAFCGWEDLSISGSKKAPDNPELSGIEIGFIKQR